MPKKSKKQKLRAKSQRAVKHAAYTQTATAAPTYSFEAAPKRTPMKPMIDAPTLTAIKMDITKSIVLAAIAISVEIVLYIVMK